MDDRGWEGSMRPQHGAQQRGLEHFCILLYCKWEFKNQSLAGTEGLPNKYLKLDFVHF